MKTTISRSVRYCWYLCCCWALACCFGTGCAAPEPRPSITFVLGDDRYDINPYYARAEAYYRQKQTPKLVSSCRSLRAVCDYLTEHRPVASPWDTITLVVHGTAWTGMGLPVLPGDSTRTTPATLAAALAAGALPPLPDAVADRHTVILLRGCALGRDTALLEALSATLGGADEECPKVVSGRLFNLYEGMGPDIRQAQADFWYTNYPTGQRPPDSVLARQLADKYPKTDLNWSDALQRKRPRWAGDSYRRLIVVPVHWAVTYPDSAARPRLRTPDEQRRWLAEQTELQSALAHMDLPVAGFRWSFREENLSFEAGAVEPAIMVEGQSSVCCVLQEQAGGQNGAGDYVTAQFRIPPGTGFFCRR